MGFINILVNAEEAIEQHGINTLNTGINDGWVFIEIINNGTRIPKENISRIFSPFFTTKSNGATGLGLFIAYGIIKNHGGDIIVTSEEETKFIITLPISEDRNESENIIGR